MSTDNWIILPTQWWSCSIKTYLYQGRQSFLAFCSCTDDAFYVMMCTTRHWQRSSSTRIYPGLEFEDHGGFFPAFFLHTAQCTGGDNKGRRGNFSTAQPPHQNEYSAPDVSIDPIGKGGSIHPSVDHDQGQEEENNDNRDSCMDGWMWLQVHSGMWLGCIFCSSVTSAVVGKNLVLSPSKWSP